MDRKSYVTLLSTDDYLLGVLGLHDSLALVKSNYSLFVLCSDSVSERTILVLEKYGIEYQVLKEHVNYCDNLNQRTDKVHWNHTFDKLYIWTLTQFDKVVFLDSDMQIVGNIDFLFEKPHMSAVVADKYNFPGLRKLNSGLMVIKPNLEEFAGLLDAWYSGKIQEEIVGDQDIIRYYFSSWDDESLGLPQGCNVLYSESYDWMNIIHEYDVAPVRVVHYIGKKKPWMMSVRAIIRRSRHNFLGKYLRRYGFRLLFIKIKVCYYNYRFG